MFTWELVPGKGKLGTITHSLRIRALLLHRLSGTPGKLFFPTKVFSLAGVRDGGVRVGSYTHGGVRVRAKTLAHVRAARSMVARSLSTCLSSLYDVNPKLVPGAKGQDQLLFTKPWISHQACVLFNKRNQVLTVEWREESFPALFF